AVVITVAGGSVTRARVALGGVGTKPWRSLEAEAALVGQMASATSFRTAAEAAMRDARPQSENGFTDRGRGRDGDRHGVAGAHDVRSPKGRADNKKSGQSP